MNVSGILVVVPVAEMDAAARDLAALPGVDVHHADRATGRIIVTQEAATIGAEVEGLKRIQGLPRVILAEMVHHHFEDDPELIDAIPPDLQDQRLAAVPPWLENRHARDREEES